MCATISWVWMDARGNMHVNHLGAAGLADDPELTDGPGTFLDLLEQTFFFLFCAPA